MKIIYFPFTHVSVQDRVALGTFFREVFVVSSDPEQQWSAGLSRKPPDVPGRLNRSGGAGEKEDRGDELPPCFNLLPFPGELREQVVRLLADHRQWAAHSGARPGHLKEVLRKTPYFTSDSQVSVIQSQILKQGSSEETREVPDNALLRALAFLCLARENDEQHAVIEAALSNVNKKRRALFSTLRGDGPLTVSESRDDNACCDEDSPLTLRGDGTDPGAQMTAVRLGSWFRVFKAVVPEDWQEQPLILVTTSPAVVEFFEQISSGRKLLLDKGAIYVHKETCAMGSPLQDQVMTDIESAVSGTDVKGTKPEQEPSETAFSRRLRLYHFRGDDVHRFFCREGKEKCCPLPDSWVEQGLFIGLISPGE